MGQTKHVQPIPESSDDMRARILELEEDAARRRKNKTRSMQKWRAKKYTIEDNQ